MNTFQKLVLSCLISLLVLMFAGATVRVTGAGMGCPDWPLCWGMLIPPTNAQQVDFDKLPIEKFQRKAERMGRDPALINAEQLRKEFNPRHVWTEFINRLTSLPVGFFSLAAFIASFSFLKTKPLVPVLSLSALLLVLINAIMGARVVFSGLSPVIITTHLALAMLLICVLVYCVWAGCSSPKKLLNLGKPNQARWLVGLLLTAVVIEGIMGAQVREMTDVLAKSHIDSPKESWIFELESSTIYLIHRSFSWVILLLSVLAFFSTKQSASSAGILTPICTLTIVLSQMILGLIMSQIHIYSWVQILHVGLAAILLAFNFHWLLIIPKKIHLHTAEGYSS